MDGCIRIVKWSSITLSPLTFQEVTPHWFPFWLLFGVSLGVLKCKSGTSFRFPINGAGERTRTATGWLQIGWPSLIMLWYQTLFLISTKEYIILFTFSINCKRKLFTNDPLSIVCSPLLHKYYLLSFYRVSRF